MLCVSFSELHLKPENFDVFPGFVQLALSPAIDVFFS